MYRIMSIAVLAVCTGCGTAATSHLQFPPAGDVPPTSLATNSEASSGGAAPTIERAATVSRPSATRRIIYEARVELVVDSLDTFEGELPKQIREHGGYLADARTDRSPGQKPGGTWVVRVPVERFEEFLAAIGQGGFARRLNQTSQEVTHEYVDLESRIANAKRLEERIVKLLESTRADLQEVITVEKELARARGELEQLEGRRRLLDHRTALSTITIQVQERDPYVPPIPPPHAPTLGERLAQAWNVSWSSLAAVGETALIVVVAAIPWAAFTLVLLLPLVLVGRRVWRMA